LVSGICVPIVPPLPPEPAALPPAPLAPLAPPLPPAAPPAPPLGPTGAPAVPPLRVAPPVPAPVLAVPPEEFPPPAPLAGPPAALEPPELDPAALEDSVVASPQAGSRTTAASAAAQQKTGRDIITETGCNPDARSNRAEIPSRSTLPRNCGRTLVAASIRQMLRSDRVDRSEVYGLFCSRLVSSFAPKA
jgi:hypothetical protein